MRVLILSLTGTHDTVRLFCLYFPVHPTTMTALRACQVPSVQSRCHVMPSAACQKLIVLIGERQSCNEALRGDPPTQMKALRFVLCQGLWGNQHVRWLEGHKGRSTMLLPAWVCRDRSRQGHEPTVVPIRVKIIKTSLYRKMYIFNTESLYRFI